MDVTKGSFNKWIYIEIVVFSNKEKWVIIPQKYMEKYMVMYSAKWNKQFEKVT